jgi:UDP-N-acetylglucosamine diphosphorylase / glucose-1-phosphate thymidylyltransferase / UDP-N-acetylgalactosamine diphosphorylase / glucosamine-1-phosphate N-acetyltransferase / galactosamine-1-phosphate N-acetyltransferase
MRVAFFEDSSAANFHPIALARPVFELICGRHSVRERIVRHCTVTEWGAFVREHLAESYQEAHPEAHVNDFAWLSRAPTLAINGRWLPSADAVRSLEQVSTGAARCEGHVAYACLEPDDVPDVLHHGWQEAIGTVAESEGAIEAGGVFVEYFWDFVRHNPRQLAEDFQLAGPPPQSFEPPAQVATIGPSDRFHIDKTARIEPFVVLDASAGPIAIGPGTLVSSFTQILGPCHVDRGSQLWSASVRGGTTIGPECRVGGEVETSILHSYANKHHAGFLGHSYLCPWVNLGALTTTSDLKNDYSPVRVPVRGESVETGLTKVGSFIGDHAKTGIGSLLNTGSSIGVMSMILPDGHLAPKHVPSFCRLADGELSDWMDVEQSLRTARVVMSRRNCEMTPAQERLWRRLYVRTRVERDNAIMRLRKKGS